MSNFKKKYLKPIYLGISRLVPFYGQAVYETGYTRTPIRWKYIFFQKILGFNRHAYWPVHFTSIIGNVKNIYAGIEACPGIMPGCYIHGHGKTYIGDYTAISANVGIITSNHDVYCNKDYTPEKEVRIGDYCWIGMNSVILPGVKLGDFTIVGAGSVVTKSFPEGHCIIAGNPAKLIRNLEKEKCVRYKSKYEYNGYIKHSKFEDFRKKHLSL
jgi:acetyltransferase-like isoleucine patch superfamily enzyme